MFCWYSVVPISVSISDVCRGFVSRVHVDAVHYRDFKQTRMATATSGSSKKMSCYTIYFCLRRISEPSNVSFEKRTPTVIPKLVATSWRKRENRADEVSHESTTAQTSTPFHIFTCALCILQLKSLGGFTLGTSSLLEMHLKRTCVWTGAFHLDDSYLVTLETSKLQSAEVHSQARLKPYLRVHLNSSILQVRLSV